MFILMAIRLDTFWACCFVQFSVVFFFRLLFKEQWNTAYGALLSRSPILWFSAYMEIWSLHGWQHQTIIYHSQWKWEINFYSFFDGLFIISFRAERKHTEKLFSFRFRRMNRKDTKHGLLLLQFISAKWSNKLNIWWSVLIFFSRPNHGPDAEAWQFLQIKGETNKWMQINRNKNEHNSQSFDVQATEKLNKWHSDTFKEIFWKR